MSLPAVRPKMHAGNAREASTLTAAGGDLSTAGEFYLDAVKVELLALRAHAGGVTPDSRTLPGRYLSEHHAVRESDPGKRVRPVMNGRVRRQPPRWPGQPRCKTGDT